MTEVNNLSKYTNILLLRSNVVNWMIQIKVENERFKKLNTSESLYQN